MARMYRDRGWCRALASLALLMMLVSSALAQGDASLVTSNGNSLDAVPTDSAMASQPTTEHLIPPKNFNTVRAVHASLAAFAFLGFFPLGGILIRNLESPNVVWIHGATQGFGSLLLIVAVGCGIWMAHTIGVIGHYHPIIGLSLLCALSIQPVTELLNHFYYQKYPKVIWAAHIHIWFGRFLITVGIIQGGLGFAFAASLPGASQPVWPKLLYGVAATIVWILYMAGAVVWPEIRHTFPFWVARQQAREAEEMEALTRQN